MTAHVPSHPAALVPHHRAFGAFLAAVAVVVVLAIGALIVPTLFQPANRPLTNWTEQYPGKALDDVGLSQAGVPDWSVLFPGKAIDDLRR